MGVFWQIIGSVIACGGTLCVGIIFAWPSSTVLLFQSANTTLTRPMTDGEVALFGSIASVGALCSTPLAGYLLDKIGRKKSCILFSMSHVIAWAMISFCKHVEVILTAAFIAGLGACSFLISPVYISDITQESIRGTLTAFCIIFYGIGMLVSYIIGGFLDYQTMVYTFLSISVAGTLLVTILRESPVFYMMKGQEEEAAKSIAFYRSAPVDSKLVHHEMEKLRRAFNPNVEDDYISPEEEKLKPLKEKSTLKPSLWQFIKKSKSTQRAMLLSVVLITESVIQGVVVVQVYAEPLFKEAVPDMPPTLCSILVAVLCTVTGFVAAYLTDVTGRRSLMIHASNATGVCCIILGTQLHLKWGPDWLTAVFIYMFIITYTCGGGTVPFVVGPEVFLPEVKSFMSMFVSEWAWFCNFFILFVFNPMLKAIGLGPVFYIFAIICFLSALFSVYFQPETKGLPVDAIQLLFIQKRSRKQVVV